MDVFYLPVYIVPCCKAFSIMNICIHISSSSLFFSQMIKRNINNVRRMTSHPTLPYCKYDSDASVGRLKLLSRNRIPRVKKWPTGEDYIPPKTFS